MTKTIETPFDHNGECLYCDELGEHRPGCPVDLITRLRHQPHEPPCAAQYRAPAECTCWIGRAVEFIEAAVSEPS